MKKHTPAAQVARFIKDLKLIYALPAEHRASRSALEEHPFDRELLSLSPIYRQSRKLYLSLDGHFQPRVCSTLRALKSQDLFCDELDFSPIRTEFVWFKDNFQDVVDPQAAADALRSFSDISLYHEQNHRILWRILPPAPRERADFLRYLNFAESLVVALDIVLGDEIGRTLSPVFERLMAIYRSGRERPPMLEKQEDYCQYLFAVMTATYLLLELRQPADILKAVHYILPGKRAVLTAAVKRALELSPLFIQNTNRLWQTLHWQHAARSLARIHRGSLEAPHYLPEDPLDLEEEFIIAKRVFDAFRAIP